MKTICLLMALQMGAHMLFAQNNQLINAQKTGPVNSMKDKQEYKGYTIRLLPGLPAPEATRAYGFDILKDNKLVVHQLQNPLPFSPGGIQNKDDGYKIAQWMIQEYKKTGHWQNMMPPHIAYKLKIRTH